MQDVVLLIVVINVHQDMPGLKLIILVFLLHVLSDSTLTQVLVPIALAIVNIAQMVLIALFARLDIS